MWSRAAYEESWNKMARGYLWVSYVDEDAKQAYLKIFWWNGKHKMTLSQSWFKYAIMYGGMVYLLATGNKRVIQI